MQNWKKSWKKSWNPEIVCTINSIHRHELKEMTGIHLDAKAPSSYHHFVTIQHFHDIESNPGRKLVAITSGTASESDLPFPDFVAEMKNLKSKRISTFWRILTKGLWWFVSCPGLLPGVNFAVYGVMATCLLLAHFKPTFGVVIKLLK